MLRARRRHDFFEKVYKGKAIGCDALLTFLINLQKRGDISSQAGTRRIKYRSVSFYAKNGYMRIGVTAPVKAGQNLSIPLRKSASHKLVRNSYPLITFNYDLFKVCVDALLQSPVACVTTSYRCFYSYR